MGLLVLTTHAIYLRAQELVLIMGGTVLVLITNLEVHGRLAFSKRELHRSSGLRGREFQGATHV
jgi:hypothetical protein